VAHTIARPIAAPVKQLDLFILSHSVKIIIACQSEGAADAGSRRKRVADSLQ
jgi:hypothetical protein